MQPYGVIVTLFCLATLFQGWNVCQARSGTGPLGTFEFYPPPGKAPPPAKPPKVVAAAAAENQTVVIGPGGSVSLPLHVFSDGFTTTEIERTEEGKIRIYVLTRYRSQHYLLGNSPCSERQCPNFIGDLWKPILAAEKITDLTPIFGAYAEKHANDPPPPPPEGLFASLKEAWDQLPKKRSDRALEQCAMIKLTRLKNDDLYSFADKLLIMSLCDVLVAVDQTVV